MASEFQTNSLISDNYRDLLKYQKYEDYVGLVLNRSKKILAGKHFEKVKEQSKGECDFLDEKNAKYDAKLLIDEKRGRLLGERKNDFGKFIEDIQKEEEQFYNLAKQDKLENIEDTRLYQVMKDRLLSLERDENVVFFSPIPMGIDLENSFTMYATMDNIDVVFEKIEDDDLVKERDVYFIYPSLDGKWVLRDKNHNREFIEVPELDEIIQIQSYAV